MTYLRKQGYDAEQIAFDYRCAEDLSGSGAKQGSSLTVIKEADRFFRKAAMALLRRGENVLHRVAQRRKKAFDPFNKSVILHSQTLYDASTLPLCAEAYDAFITGSDQVWNFAWYTPVLFLDFVPSGKTKLSYAASIASRHLTETQQEILQNSLRDFTAVSVREKSAVRLVEELSPVPVEEVLDPTLLLEREEWDTVCSERVIAEPYIFCYFLGEDRALRRLAARFAREHGLRLVTVPHAGGEVKFADRYYGAERLYDTTPGDFLSLIKYATYVFTDSFHAVVFSNIYQRNFFVFNRNKTNEMNSRIIDITRLLGFEQRYCYEKKQMNVQYLSSMPAVDYSKTNAIFEQQKEKSIGFLARALAD